MNREENIIRLQRAIETEEERVNDRFRAGKVPDKEDYRELDRLKRALRSERIQATKEAGRTAPLLTERFSVKISKMEYDGIQKEAATKGVNISALVRELIRDYLAKVEEDTENKG